MTTSVMQWGGHMNKRAEMIHIMLERNLISYGNNLWRLRSDGYPANYVKYLKQLRNYLKATIDWLDELIKESDKK